MMRRAWLLLPCLALLALVACEKKMPGASSSTATRLLAPEDVTVARQQSVVESLPITGTLNALTSSVVSAPSDGTVQEVLIREGERVRRGQVLARFDDRIAREAMSEQEAQLANNRSRLQLARIKLEKQRELYQKGFISKLAFDEQSSAFDVAVGEFHAQQTQWRRARKVLNDSTITAPIDGVVYQRKINPGEQAQRGSNLFSIADLSLLEVTATVPSQQVSRIAIGMEARFRIEGDPTVYSARVVRMNPVALSGTRSFAVYLRVDNRAGRLRAGQFIQGDIVVREASLVAVPTPAVHDADSKPWVMTVERGRLAHREVAVRLRSETQQLTAVDGLVAGQTVLIGSLLGLKPGDAVTLPGQH